MRRRRFLQTLGSSLFALPMLLRPREARAATTAKRLVIFFSPNGTVPQHWRPAQGSSLGFVPGSILEPLTPMKSKLIAIDGLDFKGTSNHEGGMSHMLTGGFEGGENQGTSLDLFVASRLGAGARFPALTLGVQTSAWGGSTQTRMSYRAGTHVAPDDDPAHVHRALFGDAEGAPGEIDALLLKRRSVIDLLKGELDDLGRIAGTVQKRKVDLHLEALRQMENGLIGAGSSSSGDCMPPGGIFSMSSQANESFPAVGRAQTDLLVAALACGFTRVGTIQWSHTVSPTVPSWLGISEGHHSLSHMSDGNASGVAQFVMAERWFAEQFLYLIERLDSLPEADGEGTMLDNSVVLWAKEMGDSRLHVCESVPFVIAGSGCGFFSTGRSVSHPGESHNKLMISICRAMGLDNATFGNPMHGTGELEGLRG